MNSQRLGLLLCLNIVVGMFVNHRREPRALAGSSIPTAGTKVPNCSPGQVLSKDGRCFDQDTNPVKLPNRTILSNGSELKA